MGPEGFESWKKWWSKISWHTPFNLKSVADLNNSYKPGTAGSRQFNLLRTVPVPILRKYKSFRPNSKIEENFKINQIKYKIFINKNPVCHYILVKQQVNFLLPINSQARWARPRDL